MKKVLVTLPDGETRNTFLPQEVRKNLESDFSVTYNDTGRKLEGEELRNMLFGYDAVITGWGSAMLDRSILEGNERLSMIVHTGGTVGNLVDSYAYEHGIRVLSGNLLYAESVAEGTLTYILLGLRRIPDYIDRVRTGNWRSESDNWEGLLDRTVGIVGYSTISSLLIPMLRPFRVKIKLFSHHMPSESFLCENGVTAAYLDEIFSTCDVVSVHSALNGENRNLIGKKHFELLSDGALFINTSRGAVIDENAMIEELKKNRFRAVLDVYTQEPLPDGSELRTLPNVYPIPHMAGPTLDRRPIITTALIEEMRRFYNGENSLKLEINRNVFSRMTKM